MNDSRQCGPGNIAVGQGCTLWTHVFRRRRGQGTASDRQPQIVRLQRLIDDDVAWTPADCVLAWCRSRGVESPVADSSRRSSETLQTTLSSERHCCPCFLGIDCVHALGRVHASSRCSATKPKRWVASQCLETVPTIRECGDDSPTSPALGLYRL